MKKLVTKIILGVVIGLFVLGCAGAIFAWNYYKKGIAAVSNKSEEVIITVENGQTATSILYTLDEAGLLKDVYCGKIFLKLNEIGNLQANSYILNRNMSLEEIFAVMENPTDEYVVKRKVTIVEGTTIPEIAEAIAKAYEVETTEVMDLLNDETFLNKLIEEYWFLSDDILKEGIKYPLEGYLYPETYMFNINVGMESVIKAALDTMGEMLTPIKEHIESMEWTVHEFLTFVSIVEREALFDADRPVIAGVFMNRLAKKMRLQSDITVNYAWDRTGVDVSYSHLEIDSPYNTYKYRGLPIGPISTVSKVTIDASVNYQEHNYLYFFAKEDGTVIYSSTLAEHNAAVSKYKWY